MSSSSSAVPLTEKTLYQITSALNLALLHAEAFNETVASASGNVDELRRIAIDLAMAINLVDTKARALDASDPKLIIPREIVEALVQQASSGEAYISRRLEECKAEATEAINAGVAQAEPLKRMSSKLKDLLAQDIGR